MLLTITTTAAPATDLGYLLHKHPDRIATRDHAFGTSTVFYPQADDDRCTAALVLEVDTVRLARTRGKKTPDFSLGQYVNDRPYAASSLLAVAIGKAFSTARSGRCDSRQELADNPIPLDLFLPAVPCRGGPELARQLFAPLGWTVEATPVPLEPAFPDWGDSRYVRLRLTGNLRLADALNHLYVLLPVMDDTKHYFVDIGEVDKLVRNGGEWLAAHPDKSLIARRYLNNRRGLQRVAYARLAELDESADCELEPPVDEEPADTTPDTPKTSLNQHRHQHVLDAVKASGASSVIDLGCGSGKLLRALLADRALTKVAGVDVSMRALHMAARHLKLDQMNDRQAARLQLFQGALTYSDDRFNGYDAAILMEVIEHLDPPRLPALARVVFGDAAPGTVIVTTPNVEYNAVYDLGHGCLRHSDHRFEWDRAQFTTWAQDVAHTYGYQVAITGIGDLDPALGSPTQMGVFTRA